MSDVAKPIDPIWVARNVASRMGFPGNAEADILARGLLDAEADNERLREALRDFAQLLPPERWHLLRPATKEVLRSVYEDEARQERSEGEPR